MHGEMHSAVYNVCSNRSPAQVLHGPDQVAICTDSTVYLHGIEVIGPKTRATPTRSSSFGGELFICTKKQAISPGSKCSVEQIKWLQAQRPLFA